MLQYKHCCNSRLPRVTDKRVYAGLICACCMNKFGLCIHQLHSSVRLSKSIFYLMFLCTDLRM
ncbi:hypothetical protein BDA96_03G034300 [Sorghum bicolor]|uniref:Uncharacterized protein n=2 Tax=Sorghum bicolor TaxID=4558 RepID=A0A921RBS2_SORBI|nr:hypothetical protein BDA96_10G044800 [Sorghum bicolor]KAG0521733.1 hypothetical protein BDA96_08G186500 [Sorghum bicolor]KAG0536085.1 hypothetical protein BDA96_03G034300 [Sorghum bicolor]KXG39326.1 hypothetical protein SORBI_3001G365500 [Sorghum bicolor]